MSNFDLRKFLAEGKLHEEMTSTEEAMDKPSKMKMSELKAKIRTEILAELSLNEDDDIDFGVGGEETQADVDFYEGLEEATKDGDGKVPAKDTDTDIDIKDEEEVEVDVKEKPKMSMKVDDNFLDQLEDLKDEADAIGDNKLERQIDNTITYFTRQHIAKDTNESLELEEAYDELEENLTKDQIQKKYNEMFGKNPQTKFADVAKALNTTEQEIAAALFSLPMLEADKDYYDAAERDDAAHIAALEKDMKDDKRSSMKESLEILKMKKLAGLITEGEYAKALLREMEGDIFDYSNLVLGTINRLIDMEEKGENILNILGRISEWNELVDLAREEVGDSFDYSNLVLGTINQLINMGEKGQSVLNILGRISEWNEVVDLAREA